MTAIMITGVGRRFDIVASFAALTTVVATETSRLAPAQYAAQVRATVPRLDDPDYVPELRRLCALHEVGAVIPLIDPDIEVLAAARARGELPALVPDLAMARATFDKYETHLLLERLGLPSPPTRLPEDGAAVDDYPVVVKPRWGSNSRGIHFARDGREAAFFAGYADEPVIVQRAMGGPEFSIDCLCDLDGVCLNAIPRSMIESRGGESVKGTVLDDPDLIELGRAVAEAVGARGACMVQAFRDPELGLRVTDVNVRFGGGYPSHMYGALPGRTYPELIVRLARGETVAPHVGELRAGLTFARYYWQLELDEDLVPTGREIVAGGPPRPRR
ncbi:MAG TPA: ATP-grasp domain-containing protein [Solirubrobacteraceae bacterium]|nr:ATP-grasp domain-containing protein [Solirubrobacteraceae bacterium]